MPTKRKSDCTPEEYALIRERAKVSQKRYEHTEKGRAANRRKSKSKWARKGDEMRAKKREYERRMRIEKPERYKALALRKRIKNPEAARRRERRRYWRAASPKRARELMLDLYRMVPQMPSRDEIVAEAAMLVVEGMKIDDAVESARKKTINTEYQHKFNKQIEECFWL